MFFVAWALVVIFLTIVLFMNFFTTNKKKKNDKHIRNFISDDEDLLFCKGCMVLTYQKDVFYVYRADPHRILLLGAKIFRNRKLIANGMYGDICHIYLEDAKRDISILKLDSPEEIFKIHDNSIQVMV